MRVGKVADIAEEKIYLFDYRFFVHFHEGAYRIVMLQAPCAAFAFRMIRERVEGLDVERVECMWGYETTTFASHSEARTLVYQDWVEVDWGLDRVGAGKVG